MSAHFPRPFKLTEGVDAYNPDVVSDLLTFFYLNNVEPRLGRLFSSKGYQIFQTLTLATGDVVVDFGFYQLSNRRFNELYAFSKTNIYWFDFSTELFDTTPIYTNFPSNDYSYVILPWYDAMYVTKPQGRYIKLTRKIVTEIADAPFARYGIIANSHAYLVGVGDSVSNQLARIRWSDLDDPESFIIDSNASEADWFDLEPDSRQITGVSYQRGSPLTYAENNIWIGTPIGIPGGFRHDPLFPGIGNIFHDALVRLKEIDFFIGADNIYQLNGLQLVPIGDSIFERFITSVKVEGDTSVRGYIDSRKNQVFWVYTKTDDSLWSIVYNYKEKKWSERDPQNLTAWLDTPRIALRGYDAIDDISTVIDTDSDLIDDPNAGYPVILPQLVGSSTAGKEVAKVSDSGHVKLDSTAFAHVIETFDFYFKTLGEMNEVTKALIEYVGSGSPNLTVKIGTRDNQANAITWSASKAVDNTLGSLVFYIRSIGVGKFLRFKFEWGNTVTNRITDLRLLSLVSVETNDSPEK